MKNYDVLNELVPKTQELHREIFDKGYEQGQKDILEQQPCEDAVSRQDALNCVTSNEFRYRMVEDIKALPSVTPKEKSEYEHDHEVVKAYNDGQAYILDRIRAEIEDIPNNEITKPIGTYDYCMGANNERKIILDIIDKYRDKQIILKKRTPEERKAYVEGYNACNKQFRKYLKKEKTVEDAIKTMNALVFALSYGVTGKEGS